MGAFPLRRRPPTSIRPYSCIADFAELLLNLPRQVVHVYSFVAPQKDSGSAIRTLHRWDCRFSRRTRDDTPPAGSDVLLPLRHCPRKTGSARPRAGRIREIAAEA